MQPGIYSGIPADEYHGGPGINVSTLKVLAEEGGPARVRYGAVGETKAQRFGSLIHTAVLEPSKLDQIYAVTDLPRTGTKAWEAAEQEAMGRELVKRHEYEQALYIRDAVFRWSPVAREIIGTGDGASEQSFYYADPETGQLCRGRIDLLHRPFGVLLDLKSCERATYEDFRWSIKNYKYHWQHAWYEDGIKGAPGGFEAAAFIFLAVEKESPYLTAAYEIDPADVADGRDSARKQLRHYVQCVERDEWPGLPDTLQVISLPQARGV